MKKIIITSLLIILTIGIVAASDVDQQLQTPSNYGEFKNSCATYTTYNDRIFFIENSSDSIKSVYFENDTGYLVIPVNDNIYYFEDILLEQYGYSEIVEINNNEYIISILQTTKLSPSEKNILLDHLKEFNKINNLTPITP